MGKESASSRCKAALMGGCEKKPKTKEVAWKVPLTYQRFLLKQDNERAAIGIEKKILEGNGAQLVKIP